LILVVDALDECDSESDIRGILELFKEVNSLAHIRFRLFLTSRPETPISLSFKNMPTMVHYDLILHDICQATIEGDLSVFFKLELTKIRAESDYIEELPLDWPGDKVINALVQRAHGLFIYAATACRFIKSNDDWSPPSLLRLFLSDDSTAELLQGDFSELPSKSPTSTLDDMYMQILNHSLRKVDELDKGQLTGQFKQIVGSIVILLETLSIKSLAALLGMPKPKVKRRLRNLHSILDVPEDDLCSLRLCHPSFRDFLLDEQRCCDPDFWVDENKAHAALAKCCMQLMSSDQLKQDICNLHEPGILARKIPTDQIEQCLPAELQYACRHWVGHLLKSKLQIRDGDQVDLFLRQHLLHWLEALSLMRKTSEGVYAIILLESIISVNYTLRELED
jgi:hypothetical protein